MKHFIKFFLLNHDSLIYITSTHLLIHNIFYLLIPLSIVFRENNLKAVKLNRRFKKNFEIDDLNCTGNWYWSCNFR